MKINLQNIKAPLQKNVSIKNGEIEVSLSSMDKKDENIYKSFMNTCASSDKEFVDTSEMDEDSTMKACAVQFDKMKSMLMEKSESGELTPAQKKLPPAIQKAILQKMDKPDDSSEHEEEETEEEEDMEEGEASGQKTKTLSRNDESKEKFDGETLKVK